VDREAEPGLPIKLNPCSNGEFVPRPSSKVVREARRRARADSVEHARRLGLSRRQFLLSSMGAATGLLALNACAKESGGGRGGAFSVPPEAATETTAAADALGGAELIVDVQTHLLDYEGLAADAVDFGSGFPQAGCGEADPRRCFSIAHWAEELFVRSDTTMVVLSAIPVVGEANPLSIEVMQRARDTIDELCGDGRVLMQGHAVPDVGPVGAALDRMAEIAEAHPIAAWKVYTHTPGGWFLDDHDPEGVPIGEAFLAQVEALGIPIVAVHKGLSGGSRFASPVDLGPAARAHPDLAFVAYHSGYESGISEGPFDPAGGGVDRLVRTVSEAGPGPGGNVYAELGTTWRAVMGAPDEAAHVLGKLLVAVGEDNVLWGTDSIWYGSPQDQIQAFRAFEISTEFQDRYGYPALTPAVKAKVLGGNAARLYGVDAATVSSTCRFDPGDLEAARQSSALPNRTYGPVSASQVASTFAREHPWVMGP